MTRKSLWVYVTVFSIVGWLLLSAILSFAGMVDERPDGPAKAGSSINALNCKAKEEARLQERINAMKADPGSLFYAKSNLSPGEQDRIAQRHLKEIQKLNRVKAFDLPDDNHILEHTRLILLDAPDSRIAQIAHWNLHVLYMTMGDEDSASQALESYIDKYPENTDRRLEAFDKLFLFAQRRGDWGAALYYAEKRLALDPNNSVFMLTKARALLRLGDREGGRKLLARILKEDEGSVQYNLAMMEVERLQAGAYDKPSVKEFPNKSLAPAHGQIKVSEQTDETGRQTADLKRSDLHQTSVAPPADEKEVSAGDPLLVDQYQLTLKRMKQLAMGSQIFELHNDALPSSLQELLKNGYAKEEFMRDAWGQEFYFKADSVNKICWVASAGSDGKFLGFDQKGAYTHLLGQDIIAFGTDFIFAPEFK